MEKKENGVPVMRRKNSLYFRFFRFWVKQFFDKQVVEYAEKPADGEVAVYVANHAGAYGPISMELNFDRPFRPWVIRYLADFKVCKKFFFYEFLNAETKKCKWLYKAIAFLGSIILSPLIRGYSAIRVYHGPKVMNTFKHSMQTLDEGKNVVIFPECNEYYSDYIHELNKGFVDLARMYYNERGVAVNFYPVYIAPGLHIIKVGKPVRYDPEVNYKKQRVTVTKYLRDEIYGMAQSLPSHTPFKFTGEDWDIAHEKYLDNMKEYLDLFEYSE